MPLPQDEATPTIPPKYPEAIAPNIVSPAYKTVLVDTKYEPFASLLTHIQGASWTVDYYGQMVASDDELSEWQPDQLSVYQQYMQIRGFELKVNQPLTQSQDEETTTFTVTGSATMYPFVIPNLGDAFIADVGDGRLAQFSVNRVERKTILRQTCYVVDYTLTRYMDKTLLDRLNKCVVKSYYFKKDYMSYGQYPLVVEADVAAIDQIEKYRKDLLSKWMRLFYSQEYRTVLVPGQGTPTYDHFLCRAFLKLFQKDAHPFIKHIRELNCDGEQLMGSMNLWTMLLDGDEGVRDIVAQKTWCVPATGFTYWYGFDGVAWSGVGQVVYPYLANGTVDDDYPIPITDASPTGWSIDNGAPFQDLQDMDWNLQSIFPNAQPGGLIYPDTPPILPTTPADPALPLLIHPVLIDNFYVLSEKFYTRASVGQSKLELLTNNMLARAAIDRTVLFEIIQSWTGWGRMEKFYYTPILLVLLNYALRSI